MKPNVSFHRVVPTATRPAVLSCHCLRRRFSLMLTTLLLIAFGSCEQKTVPVIENVTFDETEPTVVEATALVSAHRIDECGVCFSTQNMLPTPDNCDGLVPGTLDGEHFTASLLLLPHTVYYLAVYAVNELGTTTSQPVRLRTSYRDAKPDDNPFPEPTEQ